MIRVEIYILKRWLGASAAALAATMVTSIEVVAESEPHRAVVQSSTSGAVRSVVRDQEQPTRALRARSNNDIISRTGEVPLAIPAVGARSGVQAAARRATPAPYSLPFKGEDLHPGERYYRSKEIHAGGSQKWGYDLSAVRKRDGSWSTKKASYDAMNPKNSDYYIYGKPIYAMGPGKVIKCWRNAPENPRPFSSALGDDDSKSESEWGWHHPKKIEGYIGGGGNMLLVEEASGDLVLYAHKQPESIPQNLCPHNATYYSAPGAKHESEVPAAQQATVVAGQFLGLAGNSGRSYGPHLHVHRQTPTKQPLQLKFKHGLATPFEGNDTNLNDITSFKGKRIPPGKVLIWPPRTIGAEYARHKFPAKDYQRMFEHLADSGAMPKWLDAYSVGGKPFLNFVWRPANGAWRSYHLLSGASYQSKFTKAKQDGYRPVQVESSLVNGQVRYSVIFVKNKPGGYLARHGLTYDQHMAVMDEAKGKNLNPINVSVVSVGGQRRYTVLYRSDNIGQWQMKSRIPAANYQVLYNQNAQAGRRPSYVNAYMHNGKVHFSVIFSKKPSGARKDRHGLTPNQYQSQFTSAHQAGLLTRGVSGYDGAQSNHRYISYWRK